MLDTASTGQDFLFFLQKDHYTPTSYWNRNVMAELMQHVLKWMRGMYQNINETKTQQNQHMLTGVQITRIQTVSLFRIPVT